MEEPTVYAKAAARRMRAVHALLAAPPRGAAAREGAWYRELELDVDKVGRWQLPAALRAPAARLDAIAASGVERSESEEYQKEERWLLISAQAAATQHAGWLNGGYAGAETEPSLLWLLVMERDINMAACGYMRHDSKLPPSTFTIVVYNNTLTTALLSRRMDAVAGVCADRVVRRHRRAQARDAEAGDLPDEMERFHTALHRGSHELVEGERASRRAFVHAAARRFMHARSRKFDYESSDDSHSEDEALAAGAPDQAGLCPHNEQCGCMWAQGLSRYGFQRVPPHKVDQLGGGSPIPESDSDDEYDDVQNGEP